MTNNDNNDATNDATAAKEIRKQLRRDRISNRLNGNGNSSNNESDKVNASTSQLINSDDQISSSFQRLNNIQTKSSQLVADARVKVDQREAKRRDAETEDNAKRDQLLQQHVGSDSSNHTQQQDDDKVSSGWEQCLAATNVQDLSKLLDRQQQICEAALTKLDDIGKQLGSQLREKDHEYVTALKRNRNEVEQLQQTITNEHQLLKEAFEKELQLIEQSLNADRQHVLNTNKAELEALITQRKEVETSSLERQRQMIQQHRHEIKQTETKGEREREKLKKQLEAEVRRLEIELEDTRAHQQFDTDKLEYNVRVLTEKSTNNDEAAKQKRRIMKGKGELSRQIEIKNTNKMKGTKQNEALEADCERIEKQASGLRDKFERFKVSDDEKYKAVLDMHREDLQKLQSELDQSTDYIFGGNGAIGGSHTNASFTSDVTWHGGGSTSVAAASKSSNNKMIKGKTTCDEFGLRLENNNQHNFGRR